MPQGCVNERIWAKNGAKNKEKSRIFEYLATPIKQYFDLTKNIFFVLSDILRIRTNKSNANDVIENPTQLSYGPRSEVGRYFWTRPAIAAFGVCLR